jgi:hypothetical protein
MDEPGVGSLQGVEGEPSGDEQIDVPVVWLPIERWRGSYEQEPPK